MGNYIAGAAVFAIIGLALFRVIRTVRRGKSGCGCGCEDCKAGRVTRADEPPRPEG
ncbi:MAG: FeoB-associated Cys-rich membrane protein [Treponema sp.]|jgi:hypothetical protein|nr:FeoB-associated Cys-rich membrane protein [Treponema sp.]